MLFRAETQEARANAWLGRVILVRPVSFAILTACCAVLALAMLAFFVFGEYTRKARVTGVIVPVNGIVRIVAPQAGVVRALEAFERATGRQLSDGERERFLKTQHQANRWTYIGSGMTHPNFLATLESIAPEQRARVDQISPMFC